MPGSSPLFKREVATHIRAQIGNRRAVDLGAGMGWWADLIGHRRLDAVEVFAPYVERYRLRDKYREVYIADVCGPSPDAYGWEFAILGDVLEHLTIPAAQEMIRRWTQQGCQMVVAVPFLSPQPASAENPAEEHIQADLTPEVMAERYPDLRPLALTPEYGYFVNYETAQLVPDGLPPLEPPQFVHVLWWEGARGYADHTFLRETLAGVLYPTPRPFRYVEATRAEEVGNTGCVTAISGRWQAKNARALEDHIGARAWTLACLVSDEEGDFPAAELHTPTSLVTVQTPNPHRHDAASVWGRWPLGYRHDTRAVGAGIPLPPAERPLFWSFAGQVCDNAARQSCVRVLESIGGGEIQATGGFMQGRPYPKFLAMLARTHIAPSPSGPATPDCFRTWEALEMGCLPVGQMHSPTVRYPEGYYRHLFDGHAPPFPVVEDWDELRGIISRYRDDRLGLTRDTNRASAWWQKQKRQFVLDFEAAIHAVSGMRAPEAPGLRSRLTVLMPTSPIPAHPSLHVVEEAIARIRAYPDLAECEIILMIDGVRPEQAWRLADYSEYTRRVLWRCNWDPAWRGVLPLVFDEHTHQATMTRRALEIVQTPLVFFVEHDTWPVGEIPFGALARTVENGHGGVQMLRLHYDTRIHPEHEYLMLDGGAIDAGGVPVRRTRQWSQRPHLARADWYRNLLAEHFRLEDRTMIEDAIYGPAVAAPWERFGLAIYEPSGDVKRSATCDGRQSDPKFFSQHAGRRLG